MSESKQNSATDLVTIKMPRSVWNWLKDEQHRIRQETGHEPTQADLLTELIAQKSNPQNQVSFPAPKQLSENRVENDWLDKVTFVLHSAFATGIKEAIEVFFRLAKRASNETGRTRGSAETHEKAGKALPHANPRNKKANAQ